MLFSQESSSLVIARLPDFYFFRTRPLYVWGPMEGLPLDNWRGQSERFVESLCRDLCRNPVIPAHLA